MNGTMTASRLRIVLITAIFLLALGVASGFWFVHGSLLTYATDVSKLNADAESGDSNIQTLQSLRGTLDEKQQAIVDARSLIASSSDFPNKAVEDIERIAAEAGVKITSIEYSESSESGAASTPSSAATATTPQTPAASTTPAAPGVTKKSITVVIQSPLRYSSLMDFIKRIENNDLNLQIDKVSITKDQGDMVGTQTFSIGVYVR